MPWQMSMLGFECRLPTSVPETLTRIAIVNPIEYTFCVRQTWWQRMWIFYFTWVLYIIVNYEIIYLHSNSITPILSAVYLHGILQNEVYFPVNFYSILSKIFFLSLQWDLWQEGLWMDMLKLWSWISNYLINFNVNWHNTWT